MLRTVFPSATRARSSAVALRGVASTSRAVHSAATSTSHIGTKRRQSSPRLSKRADWANASNTVFAVEQRRLYSDEVGHKYTKSEIAEQAYHSLADDVLVTLTDTFEQLIEQYYEDGERVNEADLEDPFEVDYSSGVLNLRLGRHGTYVLNKQPPNKQIWLSSPKSGPKRFDYDATHDAWFMHKEGQEHDMQQILDTELSEIFGTTVEI